VRALEAACHFSFALVLPEYATALLAHSFLFFAPLSQKLGLVNGVLFTGGSQKNGSYFETIKRVFQVHYEHRFILIACYICKK
jgi:hypothetical protein